jgi:hypothetical protein
MADYTFPHISFDSRILGPVPSTAPWRDGYAIIGEFNRGPLRPVTSKQRSVLASLFGEDSSSGSIALQQALQQGAANATAIRVVPSTQPGYLRFYLAGEDPNVVPKTGFESGVSTTNVLDVFNRTTGLRLTFDYIGSPVSAVTHYGELRTETGHVTHPNFFGRGQFNFNAQYIQKGNFAEPVVYEDSVQALQMTVRNTAPEEYQIVSYTEGNNAYVENFLNPGFSLLSSENGQQEGLTIASQPFYINEDAGLKGIVVTGHFSPSTTVNGVVTSISGLREITFDATFGALGADWEPTADQLTILEDSALLINESVYLIESAANTDASVTLELGNNLSSTVEEDSRVTIAPRVASITPGATTSTVAIKGLTSSTIVVGTKLTFGHSKETFVVDSVTTPYVATTGLVTVTVAGNVAEKTKVNDYIVLTAPNTAAVTKPFRVHFPSKSKILVSYGYVQTDTFANLSAQQDGYNYFKVPNLTGADAYYVLTEGNGNKAIEFKYLVAPLSYSTATVLGQESVGIKILYGLPNDSRLNLTQGTQWTVPFVRTQVVVGGRAGTPEAYAKGTPLANIMRDLEYAIYADPAFSSMTSAVENVIGMTPYMFQVRPSITGLESNRCLWNLVRYVAGPELVFSAMDDDKFMVESVSNVVINNYEDYGVTFNGTYYPISAASTNYVEFDMPSEVQSAFSDELYVGALISLESQDQTRDVLMSLTKDGIYTQDNYGPDKYYAYTGGRDSGSFAYRDFYALDGRPLVRIQALSPGDYGNNIRVTIIPDEVSEGSARFYLQVEDTSAEVSLGGPKVESFYLDNKAVNTDTGVYVETETSNLVRVYLIPAIEPSNPIVRAARLTPDIYTQLPLRLAPALEAQDNSYSTGFTRFGAQGSSTISDVFLRKGTNFSAAGDATSAIEARKAGYLEALELVRSIDVTWIGVVGIYYGDNDYKEVFEKLKEIVDSSGPSTGGFRRAVVQLSPTVTPRSAGTMRTQVNSPRFIQIAGMAQGRSMSGIAYRSEPVVGAYIGLGASRGPHLSPASTYGERSVIGFTYSSINPTPSNLEAYTQSGTEVFYLDPGLNVFKFLNGISSTTNNLLRHVSVVHSWDQARDRIYKSLLSYRSQNISPQLLSRIASACDAVLAEFVRNEMLSAYQPTICDARNNSEDDARRGIINILIQARPIFPGDYLKVTDILDFRSSLTINALPGPRVDQF